MSFDFNVHQRNTPFTTVGEFAYRVMPPLVCADGFSISVQASETHYCTPRQNNCDEYLTVEVGYPSERVDALMEYAEDPSEPTRTVYGGVPVSLVNTIVDAHGGLSGGAS